MLDVLASQNKYSKTCHLLFLVIVHQKQLFLARNQMILQNSWIYFYVLHRYFQMNFDESLYEHIRQLSEKVKVHKKLETKVSEKVKYTQKKGRNLFANKEKYYKSHAASINKRSNHKSHVNSIQERSKEQYECHIDFILREERAILSRTDSILKRRNEEYTPCWFHQLEKSSTKAMLISSKREKRALEKPCQFHQQEEKKSTMKSMQILSGRGTTKDCQSISKGGKSTMKAVLILSVREKRTAH